MIFFVYMKAIQSVDANKSSYTESRAVKSKLINMISINIKSVMKLWFLFHVLVELIVPFRQSFVLQAVCHVQYHKL